MDSSFIEVAHRYRSLNLNIVPVKHGTKMPSIEWKPFQTTPITEAQINEWFADPSQGIGVVCGKVSGNLVCLDFDTVGAYEEFVIQHPWVVDFPTASSARGKHVFFRSSETVKSGPLYFKGFDGKAGDLIAERKFVVLPPTIHPTGIQREWVMPIGNRLPQAKLSDFKLINPPSKSKNGAFEEGDRHESLLQYAVKLAQEQTPALYLPTLVRQANRDKCRPPLPAAEVDGIVQFVLENCVITTPMPRQGVSDDSYRAKESVITSPSLGEGGDDDARFGHLFTAAPEYMECAPSESILEWLVEGMLPLSYLVILGATSKAGKSCLATHLAHAVCTGSEFLDHQTRKGSVLWLAYEENEAERRMILEHYRPVADQLFITHDKILVDSQSGIEGLRYWIQRTQAALLVVDPLYCAVGAESMSDGRKARGALEGLKDLCRTSNVTALVLHHLTKNVDAGLTRERFADSNQILAAASMDWIMDATMLEDGSREIRLHGTGRGDFANQTWVIHSTSPTSFSLLAHGSRQEVAVPKLRSKVLQCLCSASKGMTASEITQAIEGKLNSVKNCLTDLVTENQICLIGKHGNASVYAANRVLIEA